MGCHRTLSQYLSIRYTARLTEAGIEPSVGSVSDSYECALVESVIGLFKTVLRRRGPRRSVDDVKLRRLSGSIGSTRSGCSNQSGTCRARSTKPRIISRPTRWHSRDSISRKPGTI
jgi:hypothetical protein